ncbi:MAG: DUF86 domain-containing protein [Chitinophagaceae bacterium]|nr:DUF86 domain-containing protein [Chitinophagaceae bacterium]
MDEKVNACLFDILTSIHEIDSFFLDSNKSLTAYKNDTKTRRAVERNIEIIGEAMNRILQTDLNISISNSRSIVDTRNRIIHGYDTVSDEITWSIVISQLPLLKGEIEKLLGE